GPMGHDGAGDGRDTAPITETHERQRQNADAHERRDPGAARNVGVPLALMAEDWLALRHDAFSLPFDDTRARRLSTVHQRNDLVAIAEGLNSAVLDHHDLVDALEQGRPLRDGHDGDTALLCAHERPRQSL